MRKNMRSFPSLLVPTSVVMPDDKSRSEEQGTNKVTSDEQTTVLDQRSWLDVAMVSINNHLQAFRMLPWVIGGVGALLLVRYSGMFTRYRKAVDIPSHLISRGATLRGVAVGAWPDGRLDVWHTPPGWRWLGRRHKTPPTPCPPDQLLGVRLAALAVDVPEKTHSWIRDNLIGRSLRLQLVHLSLSDDSIHCIVTYRKGYLRRLKCANTELLSLGLASLQDLSSHGYHGNNGSLGNDERLIKFLSEGVRAERGAQRRGEGVWRAGEHEAKWRKLARLLRLIN